MLDEGFFKVCFAQIASASTFTIFVIYLVISVTVIKKISIPMKKLISISRQKKFYFQYFAATVLCLEVSLEKVFMEEKY